MPGKVSLNTSRLQRKSPAFAIAFGVAATDRLGAFGQAKQTKIDSSSADALLLRSSFAQLPPSERWERHCAFESTMNIEVASGAKLCSKGHLHQVVRIASSKRNVAMLSSRRQNNPILSLLVLL